MTTKENNSNGLLNGQVLLPAAPSQILNPLFQQYQKLLEPYGELSFKYLPNDESIVDAPTEKKKKSIFSSFFSLFSSPPQPERCYVVYIPNSITKSSSSNEKYPLVFLFHGTNETCFTTELFKQIPKTEADSSSSEVPTPSSISPELLKQQYSWFHAANECKLILVFGQSRGMKHTYFSRAMNTTRTVYAYGWQPGTQDTKYVNLVLKAVTEQSKSLVDVSRIYGVGFSNGGMFTSDLLMNLVNLYSSNEGGKEYPHRFAALVNYMGGVDWECQKEFSQKEIQYRIPYMIITGTRDENLGPCNLANKIFKEKQYAVTFECIPDEKHRIEATKTVEIVAYLLAVGAKASK